MSFLQEKEMALEHENKIGMSLTRNTYVYNMIITIPKQVL